jgi:hypothetical protein
MFVGAPSCCQLGRGRALPVTVMVMVVVAEVVVVEVVVVVVVAAAVVFGEGCCTCEFLSGCFSIWWPWCCHLSVRGRGLVTG